MLQADVVDRAKQANVADLAGRYVALRRASAHEFEGPCPKCGGDDRFHCTAEWFMCRQCHEKRGDAIEFTRWMTGVGFQAAVVALTGVPLPERKPQPVPASAPRREQSAAWREQTAEVLAQAQAALWSETDTRGAEYLADRGLMGETWRAFGVGFGTAHNRETGAEAPAIALPWYRAGWLTAIRWRFLFARGKHKITAQQGSVFGGQLFGGQAMPDWTRLPQDPGRRNAEMLHTLVICEGEINAMSIWQVAHDAALHVLSLGSEGQRLPDGAVAVAKNYGRVLVWMDKQDFARKLAAQVPGAGAFGSPGGKDANDLLQAGKLHDVLYSLRLRLCCTDEERVALRYAYETLDAAQLGHNSPAPQVVEDVRPWLPDVLRRTFATFGEARTYQLAQAQSYRSRLGRDGSLYFVRGI